MPKGKRIKSQAKYECLYARYFFKAQGGMRAKPDMKPWVSTDKSKKSSFRCGTNSASIVGHLLWGCAAPTGLKNVYQSLAQGASPGLGRSVALVGLIYTFTTNQLLGCFDALVLPLHNYDTHTLRSSYSRVSTSYSFL